MLLPNFLNGIIHYIFLELSIITFREIKMITWSWSANSKEPDHTAQTGGKVRLDRCAGWPGSITVAKANHFYAVWSGSILLADLNLNLDFPKNDYGDLQKWNMDSYI